MKFVVLWLLVGTSIRMNIDLKTPGGLVESQEKWYNLGMQKTITSIGRLAEKRNDEFVPGSIASRVGLVWPLTREVASLSNQHDVERRLQRIVAVLSRRRG